MKDRELEIPSEAPFTNCKLNRAIYANVLTSIIEAYSDGFVLAVDGKWGSGKTTFMKMWRQSLSNKKYKTIYFNAWENDFTSEPMVAIMGEIRSVISEEDRSTLDNILVKGQKFCNAIIPALAKVATSLSGMGSIADAVEKAADAMLQTIDAEIKEYESKKNELAEFRKEISEFITEKNGGKPIVFIVDELDRCRPDYAVEVLEKIKHLFAVDGIVFVLSIDKEQLGNAIRGYYGSDRIDADEYLRRFIDLGYTLPAPNYEDFCKYLYSKYALDEFCEAPSRASNWIRFDSDIFFTVVSSYCEINHLPLRQMEKLFIHTRIVLKGVRLDGDIDVILAFLLTALKWSQRDIYNTLRECQKDYLQLCPLLEEAMQECLQYNNQDAGYTAHYYADLFVAIINLYNNSYCFKYRGCGLSILSKDEEGNYEASKNLKYANISVIDEVLKRYEDRDIRGSLQPILNKIDLLSPLVS